MTDAREVIASALHPDLATALLRAFETAYSNALGDPFGSYLEDDEAEEAMLAVVGDLPAVLAAAGLSITETPDAVQWGIRCPDSYVIFRDTDKGQQDWSHEAEVRAIAATWNDPGYVVVRRRPAGPWEVAP